MEKCLVLREWNMLINYSDKISVFIQKEERMLSKDSDDLIFLTFLQIKAFFGSWESSNAYKKSASTALDQKMYIFF